VLGSASAAPELIAGVAVSGLLLTAQQGLAIPQAIVSSEAIGRTSCSANRTLTRSAEQLRLPSCYRDVKLDREANFVRFTGDFGSWCWRGGGQAVLVRYR
jgi:hypothetical protein